jgi:phage anti-repressor protein
MELSKILPIMNYEGDVNVQAVSAVALYSALHPKSKENYSRWVKKNITGNQFAAEKEDWVIVVKDDEYSGPGQKAQDYVLKMSFAKKIAMMSKTKKGEEIRDYFIVMESVAHDKQPKIPESILGQIGLALVEADKRFTQHDNRIQALEAANAAKVDLTKALPNVPDISPRLKLNQIVRTGAENLGLTYRKAWEKLYSDYLYRFRENIRVKANNLKLKPLDYAEAYGRMDSLLALAVEIYA